MSNIINNDHVYTLIDALILYRNAERMHDDMLRDQIAQYRIIDEENPENKRLADFFVDINENTYLVYKDTDEMIRDFYSPCYSLYPYLYEEKSTVRKKVF